MIPIELGQALVLYSTLLALLIAGIWIYTEFSVRRPQRSLGKQFLWRCEICRLSYLDEIAETLSRCPRCKSFNLLEGAQDEAAAPKREIIEAGKGASTADGRRNTSRRKRHHQKRRGPRRRR